MKSLPPAPLDPASHASFPTTHWSVVLGAGEGGSTANDQALEVLCRAYWSPLYAYLRRQGYSAHDAQDLTQDFFARLLQKNILNRAQPDRGRFRSFLLASLKNFLANEWDRAQAQKRGGRLAIVSFDAETAEARYQSEPASNLTPEMIFDQRYAMTVLDRALARLEDENTKAKCARSFALLKGFITSPPEKAAYDAVAAELQMPASSVAVMVHRLRARFGKLVRAEVADTVANPEDVDDELRHLCATLQ
jgi:RNA polymerase sigma factor (sigma-70 family)